MPSISTSIQLRTEGSIGTQLGEDKPFNYITGLQKLVAQILLQLQQIATNDSQSVERMKRSYFDATFKAADLQKDYGRTNLWLGAGAFTVTFSMFGFANAEDRNLLQTVGNQIPNFFGLATSGIQSRMGVENAKATIEIEMYRSKTSEKSSEGSVKQDSLTLLQAVKDLMMSATRPN